MRKLKTRGLILLGALAILFAGCAQRGALEKSGTVGLPEQMECALQLHYSGLELKGRMTRTLDGELALTLEQPGNLSGLTLETAPEEYRTEYEGIRFAVDRQVLPKTSVPGLLKFALDTANGLSFKIPSGKAPYQIDLQTDYGKMELVVDRDDQGKFLPIQITIDNLEFQAVFDSAPTT
ncbi:hypothetical protein [Harryflintia acetispora]|uniref:hypothetical protein n=1 Tax=Harryflintia acetispora TaxID=1849041 RepID=UPI00189C34DE|nr:hypothetical protein [Harryflintia acetispora]